MPEIVARYWYRLASDPDPSSRNLIIVLSCIAIYWIFLARGDEGSPRQARRPRRTPDSVLRGGG